MDRAGSFPAGCIMNILFLSRKQSQDIGGLSRFIMELTHRFPRTDWRRPIDCIHATDATLLPFGVLLKLLLGAPLTVTAHGRDITWPHPLYRKIFSFCTPHVNAWIVDSPAASRLLRKQDINKIRVIPPGISIGHFNREKSPALPHVPGKTVLMTVGNLVRRKGHAWFIRNVLSRLPSRFSYIIVGAGKERDHIDEIIIKSHVQDRVFLPGRINHKKLADLLKKAHIYVAPNQRIHGDFEGFGIAAGEAAAMGLPVLASRVDGLPAVIHHNKNGLLVQPTPSAWVSAILSMESPKTRAALGAKARRYTREHFSWKKTVRQYSVLFRAVAGKK